MSDVLFNMIKLVLTVLLLPIVWVCGVELHGHVAAFPRAYGEFFLWGMFGFLLCSLFFYQFWGVYELGQRITAGLFQFVSPANRFIASIIPFYLTAIIVLFYATTNFLDIKSYDHYFMFFAGFAFTMHILLTAQDLQEREKTFIKPSYLFTMTAVWVLVTFITVLLLDLVLGKFTFPRFFRSVVEEAWDVYRLTGEKILFWK